MLLSKEIAVYLNLSACKLKQYTASMLKQNNVGLTPEQFLLVDLLWNQGPMSQQNMADAMQKDKNSITKLTDALEKKGLVVRIKDENDRRSNKLVLTPAAEKMKMTAKEAGISMLDKLLEGISPQELRQFLDTLGKITNNMSK
ncbi:MAG: MarR family transcriptional regulator [Bacteroidales bacterium]|nr:MarR family transcriptional regulator [Candidatus Cacconaster merdequi]